MRPPFGWRPVRTYLEVSLGALIAGILIFFLEMYMGTPQLDTSVLTICSELKDVSSIPLLQAMGIEEGAAKLSYLLRTNLLYECIALTFVPGLLHLAAISLIFRYLLLGAIVSMVLLSGLFYVLALMAPIVTLEMVGFSLTAVAADRVGRAWLWPSKLYGKGTLRKEALRRSLEEALPSILLALFILLVSSLLEAGLSYVIPPF